MKIASPRFPGSRFARCLGVAALLLVGFGVAAVDLDEYLFPLRTGARWDFRVVGGGTAAREVGTGVSVPGGRQAFPLTSSDAGGELTYWVGNEGGLQVYQIDDPSQFVSLVLSGPLLYVPATMEIGQTHRASVSAGLGFFGQEPQAFDQSASIVTVLEAAETVTVPAGSFACLRLRLTEGTNPAQTWWLARGLGVVKQAWSGGSTWELAATSLEIPKAGPVITVQPTPRTLTEGTDATFSVTATGTPPLQYQWWREGLVLGGATTATWHKTAVTTSDAGDYWVVVSNASGSVTSSVARLTVNPATPAVPLKFLQARAPSAAELELRFTSEPGKSYRLESTGDLTAWSELQAVESGGAETTTRVPRVAGEPARFFRLRVAPAGAGVLTLPVPGQLYPAGTRLGGALFGIDFTIPDEWKGGLRVGSVFLMFGSDTRPGLILGILGFAGTREELLADESLRLGFETDLSGGGKVRFVPTAPLQDAGPGRLREEFGGQDPNGNTYWLGIDFVLHPDGGYVAFLGLTTAASKDSLRVDLDRFVATARTTRRPTHSGLVETLGGRSYQWAGSGSDWYKGDLNQKASLSSWNESFAFFCRNGTVEISTKSTGYASTSNSGGWSTQYMSLSYDSTTKEYGQFTIVSDPQYGDVLLLATLKGYQVAPIRLNPDGSLLVGDQRLAFHELFRCGPP